MQVRSDAAGGGQPDGDRLLEYMHAFSQRLDSAIKSADENNRALALTQITRLLTQLGRALKIPSAEGLLASGGHEADQLLERAADLALQASALCNPDEIDDSLVVGDDEPSPEAVLNAAALGLRRQVEDVQLSLSIRDIDAAEAQGLATADGGHHGESSFEPRPANPIPFETGGERGGASVPHHPKLIEAAADEDEAGGPSDLAALCQYIAENNGDPAEQAEQLRQLLRNSRGTALDAEILYEEGETAPLGLYAGLILVALNRIENAADGDRNSIDYIEAIHRLLRIADPEPNQLLQEAARVAERICWDDTLTDTDIKAIDTAISESELARRIDAVAATIAAEAEAEAPAEFDADNLDDFLSEAQTLIRTPAVTPAVQRLASHLDTFLVSLERGEAPSEDDLQELRDAVELAMAELPGDRAARSAMALDKLERADGRPDATRAAVVSVSLLLLDGLAQHGPAEASAPTLEPQDYAQAANHLLSNSNDLHEERWRPERFLRIFMEQGIAARATNVVRGSSLFRQDFNTLVTQAAEQRIAAAEAANPADQGDFAQRLDTVEQLATALGRQNNPDIEPAAELCNALEDLLQGDDGLAAHWGDTAIQTRVGVLVALATQLRDRAGQQANPTGLAALWRRGQSTLAGDNEAAEQLEQSWTEVRDRLNASLTAIEALDTPFEAGEGSWGEFVLGVLSRGATALANSLGNTWYGRLAIAGGTLIAINRGWRAVDELIASLAGPEPTPSDDDAASNFAATALGAMLTSIATEGPESLHENRGRQGNYSTWEQALKRALASLPDDESERAAYLAQTVHLDPDGDGIGADFTVESILFTALAILEATRARTGNPFAPTPDEAIEQGPPEDATAHQYASAAETLLRHINDGDQPWANACSEVVGNAIAGAAAGNGAFEVSLGQAFDPDPAVAGPSLRAQVRQLVVDAPSEARVDRTLNIAQGFAAARTFIEAVDGCLGTDPMSTAPLDALLTELNDAGESLQTALGDLNLDDVALAELLDELYPNRDSAQTLRQALGLRMAAYLSLATQVRPSRGLYPGTPTEEQRSRCARSLQALRSQQPLRESQPFDDLVNATIEPEQSPNRVSDPEMARIRRAALTAFEAAGAEEPPRGLDAVRAEVFTTLRVVLPRRMEVASRLDVDVGNALRQELERSATALAQLPTHERTEVLITEIVPGGVTIQQQLGLARGALQWLDDRSKPLTAEDTQRLLAVLRIDDSAPPATPELAFEAAAAALVAAHDSDNPIPPEPAVLDAAATAFEARFASLAPSVDPSTTAHLSPTAQAAVGRAVQSLGDFDAAIADHGSGPDLASADTELAALRGVLSGIADDDELDAVLNVSVNNAQGATLGEAIGVRIGAFYWANHQSGPLTDQHGRAALTRIAELLGTDRTQAAVFMQAAYMLISSDLGEDIGQVVARCEPAGQAFASGVPPISSPRPQPGSPPPPAPHPPPRVPHSPLTMPAVPAGGSPARLAVWLQNGLDRVEAAQGDGVGIDETRAFFTEMAGIAHMLEQAQESGTTLQQILEAAPDGKALARRYFDLLDAACLAADNFETAMEPMPVEEDLEEGQAPSDPIRPIDQRGRTEKLAALALLLPMDASDFRNQISDFLPAEEQLRLRDVTGMIGTAHRHSSEATRTRLREALINAPAGVSGPVGDLFDILSDGLAELGEIKNEIHRIQLRGNVVPPQLAAIVERNYQASKASFDKAVRAFEIFLREQASGRSAQRMYSALEKFFSSVGAAIDEIYDAKMVVHRMIKAWTSYEPHTQVRRMHEYYVGHWDKDQPNQIHDGPGGALNDLVKRAIRSGKAHEMLALFHQKDPGTDRVHHLMPFARRQLEAEYVRHGTEQLEDFINGNRRVFGGQTIDTMARWTPAQRQAARSWLQQQTGEGEFTVDYLNIAAERGDERGQAIGALLAEDPGLVANAKALVAARFDSIERRAEQSSAYRANALEHFDGMSFRYQIEELHDGYVRCIDAIRDGRIEVPEPGHLESIEENRNDATAGTDRALVATREAANKHFQMMLKVAGAA